MKEKKDKPTMREKWNKSVTKANEWADKITVKDVALAMGGLAGVLLLILLGVKVLGSVANFIKANTTLIVVICGAIIAIVCYLMDKRDKEGSGGRGGVCGNTEDNYFFDDMTLDYNYDVIKGALYQTIPDIASMTNLKPPTSLSELDTDSKYQINIDFNVPLYHFTCAKTGEVDEKVIKQVTQKRINQKLQANEIDGLTAPSTHYWNSQTFPRIMVDKVYSNGSYVEFVFAFASDRYCQMLAKRNLVNRDRKDDNPSGRDKDF